LAAVALLAGCGDDGAGTTTGPAPPEPGPSPSPSAEGDRGAKLLPTGDGRNGVRLQRIGDFDQPLQVTQPPGDHRHLFVVEKTGRVQVVRDGGRLSEPFLDLSSRVSLGGEQGLLSLAFAPDYESSGLLYVDYTDTAGDTRIVEYRRSEADPLLADPRSARQVLSVDQPYSNHNGGLVTFGPSGASGSRQAADSLYIGLGDGGSADDPDRNGQDLATLLGKILRIDPRPSDERPYSIPESNPFVGTSGARPEIYAYGLRNPWRFSFDPATGALAIADVGQNEIEEVNLVARDQGKGANFGWSAYEGLDRFNDDQQAPNAVAPALVYGHNAGCSITGGYVARDRGLPSLYGRYVYGDFCAGQLRSFAARPGRRATDDRSLGLEVPSLSSFGRDAVGRLYATSLEGPVYRLGPTQR
jgi:glucose/arabinose dehydrogenase